MQSFPIHRPSDDDARADVPPILVVDDLPGGADATLRVLRVGRYRGVAEQRGDDALRVIRSQLTRLVVSELYIRCAEGTCLVTALKQERHRLPRLQIGRASCRERV